MQALIRKKPGNYLSKARLSTQKSLKPYRLPVQQFSLSVFRTPSTCWNNIHIQLCQQIAFEIRTFDSFIFALAIIEASSDIKFTLYHQNCLLLLFYACFHLFILQQFRYKNQFLFPWHTICDLYRHCLATIN